MATAAKADTITLHAQCHCRAQTIAVPVARSHFPLKAEMCHCDDCRQVSGSLALDYLPLRNELAEDLFDPQGPLPPGLLAYTPQDVTWYFCSVCGCHVVQSCARTPDEPRQGRSAHQWFLLTGVTYPYTLPADAFDDERQPSPSEPKRIFHRARHSWVRPGLHQSGMARYLNDGVPRFGPQDELLDAPYDLDDPQPGPTDEESKAIAAAAEADSVPIQCRCGYVRLRLLRPRAAPMDESRFASIHDESGQKWRFNFCMCNSCRTTMSSDGVPIVFSTHHHLKPDADHAQSFIRDGVVPKGSRAEDLQGDADRPSTMGLRTYQSSEKRKRRFCPVCASSIILDFVEYGPDLCDLFLGNFRAPIRALWQAWAIPSPKISYLAYARDRQLAEYIRQTYAPEQDYTLSDKVRQAAHPYAGELVLEAQA